MRLEIDGNVVDEAGAAELDGEGKKDGAFEFFEGLDGFAIDHLDIVDLGAGAGLDEGAHSGEDIFFGVGAFEEELFAELEGLVEDGSVAALFGVEVDVAGADGEAVGLAGDGADDDVDVHVEVGDHAFDDEGLLGIFLAEDGEVRADDVEELADDGGDTAKEDGAGDAAEGRHHVVEVKPGLVAGGIHHGVVGGEDDVATDVFKHVEVALHVAGVGGEVFVRGELGGVDVDAGHEGVGPLPGDAHEAEVAFVEVAHGGDEADGAAFKAELLRAGAHRGDGVADFHDGSVTVVAGGEAAVADVLDVGGEGVFHGAGEVGVVFEETGGEVFSHAKHVVNDEDLPVAIRPGADADGRDGEGRADVFGESGGNLLKDDGEAPRGFEGLSISEDLLGGGAVGALEFETAIPVDGLRGHADVAHNGNAHGGEAFDEGDEFGAAFEFDGVGPAFLEHAAGVTDGVFLRSLIAEEGHVGDEEGAASAAVDGLDVVKDLVGRDGQCGLMPGKDHGGGVAHKDRVDPGRIKQARGGEVVGGKHADLAALLLHGEQGRGGDFLWSAHDKLSTWAGEVAQAKGRGLSLRSRCPSRAFDAPS